MASHLNICGGSVNASINSSVDFMERNGGFVIVHNTISNFQVLKKLKTERILLKFFFTLIGTFYLCSVKPLRNVAICRK